MGSSVSDEDAQFEEEGDWDGVSSESGGEQDAEEATPSKCFFCRQDEEHDPSEEYEEALSCAVCDNIAHRQCARNGEAFKAGEDPANWRCPTCKEDGLEPEVNGASHRTASAPLTRDLLPAARKNSRPDSHSVFNQLIRDEDPLDGSRLLRKRRADEAGLSQSLSPDAPKKMKTLPVESEASSSEGEEEEDEEESSSEGSGAEDSSGSDSSEDASGEEESESDSEESESESVDEDEDDLLPEVRPKQTPIPPPRDAESESESDSDSEEIEPQSLILRQPRKRGPPKFHKQLVTIARRRPGRNLILSFNLGPDILSRMKPRKNRWASTYSPRITLKTHAPSLSSLPIAFGSFHEKVDESKLKPYGGILSEADADTSKTFPQAEDRAGFEKARQEAEAEWKKRDALAAVDNNEVNGVSDDPGENLLKAASKIKCVNFGGFEIDTWYAAPYPEEYSRNRVLYICEFCLKYMASSYVTWRHKLKCPAKHPPGDEIYRDKTISVFEVDGRKNPVYCQNLCLLAKLFLGSKTLYYDVEPFLFYVMTEYDKYGCHFVGYFSKEKRNTSMNNVSCILTMPIHQRKGYGNLLIDFSYLLTRAEKKTGSPEKPLSDMGLVSYRNYWKLVMCYELRNQKGSVSPQELSQRTGMTPDDVVSALEGLNALVRDPVSGAYALRLDHKLFDEVIQKWESKRYASLSPDCLIWTPFVQGRTLAHLDNVAISTVAQREDDEDDEIDDEMDVNGQTPVPEVNGNGVRRLVNGDHHSVEQRFPGPVAFDLEMEYTPSIEADPEIPEVRPSRSNSQGTPSVRATVEEDPYPLRGPNGEAIVKVDGAIYEIPATRFEIYPPLPGTKKTGTGKPRGRPPHKKKSINLTPHSIRQSHSHGTRRTPTPRSAVLGERNGNSYVTPPGARPTSSSSGNPKWHSVRNSSGRFTRSKMAESVTADGYDEDDDSPEPRRSQGAGSQERGRSLANGDGSDIDADGEVDADGEPDADAEGEEDDLITAGQDVLMAS